MTSTGRNFAKGIGFVWPWIIGFALFTVVPAAMSLYYSFCDYSIFQPPLFRGLENYRTLAHDPLFWKSLGNTMEYAAMALPLGLAAALGVALLLNSGIRGLGLYRTMVFLPSLVPLVASAMIWLWIFNGQYGLLNAMLSPILRSGAARAVLRALGYARIVSKDFAANPNPPTWLASTSWAMPALVLMSLWGIGYTVVIFLAALQDVPAELYEAAELDGASAARRVWHVTIPSISPVIFFNLIMGIIGTMQVFAIPFIMTQGGPEHSTYFLSMYTFDSAFNPPPRMGYASALAWVQLLIVLVLTAIAFAGGHRLSHGKSK
jgi:multiple sugar transport system permease protein